ncbi:Regulator of RpoS [bioreactor metagenome]|uniref:Regulator of RpoS n=1 Tax=bioreactor metagenome TaxID=1076179 RepID=A0A645F4D1_9ZZZZ
MCAENGKDGFELLSRSTFELVFLDIKLPEMSGTEVMRRANKLAIQSTFIIMTAYPTIKNAVECTKLGAVAYLQKPFTIERLHTLLTDLDTASNRKKEGSLLEIEQALEERKPDQALNLIKENISSYLTNPEMYHLLSRTYDQLGDKKNADRFARVAGFLMDP